MAKVYTMQFGSGDPRTFTGLSPTMLIFVRVSDGATIAPPSITESASGWGIYQFTYGTTQPIAFLADAATTSPGTSARYIVGQIDPSDRADEYGNTMVALGNSGVALSTTGVALGTTAVALGNTNIAFGTTNVAIGTSLSALGLSTLALGTTAVAIGTTITGLLNGLSSPILLAIGTTASSFGSAVSDPVDLFGYMKRTRELLEGNRSFQKGVGVLTQFDRTGGTTLYSKSIANNASLVTKT